MRYEGDEGGSYQSHDGKLSPESLEQLRLAVQRNVQCALDEHFDAFALAALALHSTLSQVPDLSVLDDPKGSNEEPCRSVRLRNAMDKLERASHGLLPALMCRSDGQDLAIYWRSFT